MSEQIGTLLVVDDNEWNRDLFSRRLRRQGFQVLLAKDGNEALELAERESPDLILLDIMMPGITGIDVLRTLRQTHPPNELPIIMATAKGQSEDIVEALDLGANDYVTKPLDFPVVLARIQAQLRNRVNRSAAPRVTVDADAQTLGPGRVLSGKYRLETSLGTGNFGAVYHATHLGLERAVAVKILQTKIEPSKSSLARFQREAISACRIDHPNAVSVLDFDVTPDGIAFLVMELLEGQSLAEELHRSGVRTPARCVQILLPVCAVLAEVHAKGIIHRDVKPGNIFLHRSRDREIVKVLDFGIAKLVDDESSKQNLTLDGGVLGTPAYMAPERFDGSNYDGRADVYSLGIMLFEMLTGQLPFVSKSTNPLALAMAQLQEPPRRLRSVAPHLSAALETVILQALEKDFRQRPFIEAFAESLTQAVGNGGPEIAAGPQLAGRGGDHDHPTQPLGLDQDDAPDRSPGPPTTAWEPPEDL